MRQEESDVNNFTLNRCSVHKLELGDVLRLVVSVLATPSGLPPNHSQLHVLYFDSNKEKVNLSKNNIFKMILLLIVLEFDMQAVFNTHFHLERSRHLVGVSGIASNLKPYKRKNRK